MNENIYKTEQEYFWAGEFGDEYIERNQGLELIASNTRLFSRILERTKGVGSVVEFGPNIGMNLLALRNLLPSAELTGIEINPKACEILSSYESISFRNESILNYKEERSCDFALIKGVLIHINPEELPTVYSALAAASRRYVCLAEYYNPTPVVVDYRGHNEKLFKRDFAGEFLDRQKDFSLIDYGFVYHRDNVFPQDDVTWFLMEKN